MALRVVALPVSRANSSAATCAEEMPSVKIDGQHDVFGTPNRRAIHETAPSSITHLRADPHREIGEPY
jgi:hypothetical protein